jgi:hypothetical protein
MISHSEFLCPKCLVTVQHHIWLNQQLLPAFLVLTHSPIDLLQHFAQGCGRWELSKLSTSVVGGWVFLFFF